jgi:hypothetical protein
MGPARARASAAGGADEQAKNGYTAKTWATITRPSSQAGAYIHAKNPAAPIMAPHWWIGDIRFLLYDTSLARGFKMRDMTE